MLALILAGEAVYALPFHIARFFRPTLLEVYGLTATELGAAQGIYGIIAMVAYFPGGPLADAIESTFGDVDGFRAAFTRSALSQCGVLIDFRRTVFMPAS